MRFFKQFVKTLNRDEICFSYLTREFPELAKKIFDSPQIGQLIKDPQFIASMNEIESKACCSFGQVVENLMLPTLIFSFDC